MPTIITRGAMSAQSFGLFAADSAIELEYLVVAGGAGSGSGAGGGGGAGGFRTGTGIVAVSGDSFTVTVGAGGSSPSASAGSSGSNSVFGTITSAGGGGGAKGFYTYLAGTREIVALRHSQAPLQAQVAVAEGAVQLLLARRALVAEQAMAVLVQHLQLADHH